jgi:hypothetical protein
MAGSRSTARERSSRREEGRRSADEAAAVQETEETERGDSSLRLSIERLKIENGVIRVRSRDDGTETFSVEDLTLGLQDLTFDPEADSSTAAVTGVGRLTTGRVVHGEIEAERAAGEIRLAGGEAELSELEVRTRNADLVIYRLSLDLLEEPPGYSLSAAGGLDLDGALGLDTEGRGFGRVAIELEAAGEGPELAEVDGGGTLILNSGAIPPIPSIVQIEELLGQALLTGRTYERADIDYRLRDNRVELSPFEIVGDGAQLGGSGVVDLAGPVDMDVFVRLPRRSLGDEALEEEGLDEFEDEAGMVTIPFQVGGTIDDPKVQLTWEGAKALVRDAAESWAEKALEEAKKRAAEWLREQSESDDQN